MNKEMRVELVPCLFVYRPYKERLGKKAVKEGAC